MARNAHVQDWNFYVTADGRIIRHPQQGDTIAYVLDGVFAEEWELSGDRPLLSSAFFVLTTPVKVGIYTGTEDLGDCLLNLIESALPYNALKNGWSDTVVQTETLKRPQQITLEYRHEDGWVIKGNKLK